MLFGQWVTKAGGTVQYTLTVPRRGLAALFSFVTLAKMGGGTLRCDVEHKNRDDTSFTVAGSFAAVTTLTTVPVDVTALKEEVRLAFSVTATNDWEGFLVLVTAPVWRPYP